MSLSSVLITGANRGIGLEFVKQFMALATPPKHIFAACRQPVAAKDLKALEASSNGSLHVVQLEVKDYASYDGLVKQVGGVVGDQGLELLINNAGVFLNVDINKGGPELMVDNFEVNAVTPLMITRAFLPLLRAANANKRKTIIVNMSAKMGTIADNTTGSQYAYRASKAGLNMVSKSLSVDLRKEGILCLAFHPGWVKTDMGGKQAPITPAMSVSNMVRVISTAEKAISGKLLNYDGQPIPW